MDVRQEDRAITGLGIGRLHRLILSSTSPDPARIVGGALDLVRAASNAPMHS
jgi:hypothetical protein